MRLMVPSSLIVCKPPFPTIRHPPRSMIEVRHSKPAHAGDQTHRFQALRKTLITCNLMDMYQCLPLRI